MQIVLVRHGEPQWTNDSLAVVDPDLTQRGQAQARHAADHLATRSFDHLLVSPLRRARQTADPIDERLAPEAEVVPFLAEIGVPAWEGAPAEYVERQFAEQRRRPVEELWEGLPGAESFLDFHERVVGGWSGRLEDLGVRQRHDHPRLYDIAQPDLRLLVVAHGGTNAVTIANLLGIPPVPWEWERFVSYHASVTVLETAEIGGAHAFTLRKLSDLSHLPPDLHTV